MSRSFIRTRRHARSRGTRWMYWWLAMLCVALTRPVDAQAAAPPKNPLDSIRAIPCASRLAAVPAELLDYEALGNWMRCDGDKAALAELLWTRQATDLTVLSALEDATIGYMTPRLIVEAGRIARTDVNPERRFAAFGLLARIVDNDVYVGPRDASRWNAADTLFPPSSFSGNLHGGAPPVPHLRPMALQEVQRLPTQAASVDIRMAARWFLQLQQWK